MNQPFCLSVVAPSQNSAVSNGLGPLDDLKIEDSSFWKKKPNDSLSRNALESDHHNPQFSRASSHFSHSSDLFKKKILESEFEVQGQKEKYSEPKTSLRDTRLEVQVMNPNIVKHANFNIPTPVFEDFETQIRKKELERDLMDQKFENKCKAICQQRREVSTNVFSFHQMKNSATRPKRFSQTKSLMEMLSQSESKKQNCFYTDLFLTSKKPDEADSAKNPKPAPKKHVNLSKINIKTDIPSMNTCKISGSRKGSRRELSEFQSSMYSIQTPRTDPRKIQFRKLKLSKPIFLKLNGLLQGSPIPSIRRSLTQMVLMNERKKNDKVKVNYAMTPNLRFVRYEPTRFQTPKRRMNVNSVVNRLTSQKSIQKKKFFPKSRTMLELGEHLEGLGEKAKSKKRPKNSKNATPKVKRKMIKKKSRKGSSKKKKKSGCRCKKTHCTRLHCICFRDRGYCDDSCSCENCYNREEFADMISHIRELTQEINPLAFKSKIQVIETKSGQKIHNRGCSCTKNNCKKNYCECFKNGLPCSPLCKCENCKNEHVSLEAEEVKKIFKKCSRKKKKFVIEIGDNTPEVHNVQMS